MVESRFGSSPSTACRSRLVPRRRLFRNAANLRAVAALGFTADCSAAQAGPFGRLQLPWTLGADAQPYYPARDDANLAGDLHSSRRRDRGQHVWPHRVVDRRRRAGRPASARAPGQPATQRRAFTVVSHPATIDATERAAIEALFRAFDPFRYDATPDRFASSPSRSSRRRTRGATSSSAPRPGVALPPLDGYRVSATLTPVVRDLGEHDRLAFEGLRHLRIRDVRRFKDLLELRADQFELCRRAPAIAWTAYSFSRMSRLVSSKRSSRSLSASRSTGPGGPWWNRAASRSSVDPMPSCPT